MKNLSQAHPNGLPALWKLLHSASGAVVAGGIVLVAVGGPPGVQAQGIVSDNFDSYSNTAQFTAAGWILSSLNPALVTTTFPETTHGKGVRLQCNPIPGTAPAVGMWYRMEDYTDFYVAIDIASWPGTAKNQAMVLFGRMTDAGTGQVVPNLNPANAQGIICNYDASQYGENPGDRRQGQFQINVVRAGFKTTTLAVGEITFVPGRSYRILFKAVGTRLTAQAYDLFDLTRPLVTLEVEDTVSGFTHGACGFLSFSRQGTSGTTDVTYDNYYSGPADPNLAPAPALSHPVLGTPQVVSRVPAGRFANFHPVASGISFNARTFTTNQIDARATKLYLNGVDVSAALAPWPANGSNVNFATAPGTLAPNTVYSARIELVDTAGRLRSTNTFWFDTFTDAYLLTPPVKTIECEDYNYSNGVFQLDPIPVSGMDTTGTMQINGFGVGYFGVVGTPDVDYFKGPGEYWSDLAEYRPGDRVMITQGSVVTASGTDEAGDILTVQDVLPIRRHDTQRSQYGAAGVWEYQVRLTQPGDWMNYTRVFEPTNYLVYLRCASFGASTVYLERVTSDPTRSGQTTLRLGTFKIANHLMRLNYTYEPLTIGGEPAVISLSGTNTLRLTHGGIPGEHRRMVVMDYLLFVPTGQSSTTIFDNFADGDDLDPPWTHYDPIGGQTAPPASFLLTNGGYRIYAPAPSSPGAGSARAGSFLPLIYTDFCVAADVIDFDDRAWQSFGLAARIQTPGLSLSEGYMLGWEPAGDLHIWRVEMGAPIGYIEDQSIVLQPERGKNYRLVFMGRGFEFVGEVYQLPNTITPVARLTGRDPDRLYPSGHVGLLVASQDLTGWADATFDNVLATAAEPRLAISAAGNTVTLSWPLIPFRLQTTSSLDTPTWTTVTTGVTQANGRNVYVVPQATGSAFYRLIYGAP